MTTTNNLGAHIPSIDKFFDITHSFKVGSSTYHVLGLRKDFPTYKNNYYIFECDSHTTRELVESKVCPLPKIEKSSRQNEKTTKFQCDEIKKSIEKNVDEIHKAINEVHQTENKALLSSIRHEIKSEMSSITEIIRQQQVESRKQNDKLDEIKDLLLRRIEEVQQSIQRIQEEKHKNLQSSIERFQSKLLSVLDLSLKTESKLEHLDQIIDESIRKSLNNDKRLNENKDRPVDLSEASLRILKEDLLDVYRRTVELGREETIKRIEQLLLVLNQSVNQSIDDEKKVLVENLRSRIDLERSFVEKLELNIETVQKKTSTSQLDQLSIDRIENVVQRTVSSLFDHRETKEITIETSKETSNLIEEQDELGLYKLSILNSQIVRVDGRMYMDNVKLSDDRNLLCQRDPDSNELVHCFFSPPSLDKEFELEILAQTRDDDQYRTRILLNIPNQKKQSNHSLPRLFESFKENQCILIEPFVSHLKRDQPVHLRIVLPEASKVFIRNGQFDVYPDQEQFQDSLLDINLTVRGTLIVFARWNNQIEKMVCLFEQLDDSEQLTE